MRVVYSDESGTSGNEGGPSVVLTALLFNMDSQWRPVRDAIEKAILDTLDPPPDLNRFLLKGHRIYQKIERLDNPRAPQWSALMAQLMAIPLEHLIPVFRHGVHKAGFRLQRSRMRQWSQARDANAPFKLAFEGCMTQVDTLVHTFCRDEEVLWIHDGGSLDKPAKATLRNFRAFLREASDMLSEMKQDGHVEPEIHEHVSHVADMIYFGNDEESRLLQLADCCCSTIARHWRGDPTVEPYYNILRRQIQNENDRPQFENAEELFASIDKHLGVSGKRLKL